MNDAPLTPEEEIEFAELEAQGYGKGITDGSESIPLTPEEEIEFAELEAQGFGDTPVQESASNYNPLTEKAYPRGYVPDADRGAIRETFDNVAGAALGYADDLSDATGLTKAASKVDTYLDFASDVPIIGELASQAGAYAQEAFGGASAEDTMGELRDERAQQRIDNPIPAALGDMTSYAVASPFTSGGLIKAGAKLGAIEGADTYLETGDIDQSIDSGATMAAFGYGLGVLGKAAVKGAQLTAAGTKGAAAALSETIKTLPRGNMIPGAKGMAYRGAIKEGPKYLDKIARGEKGSAEDLAVALMQAEAKVAGATNKALKGRPQADWVPPAPIPPVKPPVAAAPVAPPVAPPSAAIPTSGPGFNVKPKAPRFETTSERIARARNKPALEKARLAREKVSQEASKVKTAADKEAAKAVESANKAALAAERASTKARIKAMNHATRQAEKATAATKKARQADAKFNAIAQKELNAASAERELIAKRIQQEADKATKKKVREEIRDKVTLGRAGAGNILTERMKTSSNTHYQSMQTDAEFRKAYMKRMEKEKNK